MDPVSLTVSALTLLEAAGLSARLVCRLFRDFRDAPAEIQFYCQLLDGLVQTFSAFEAFESQEYSLLSLPTDFSQRLSVCVADLQAVHAKIERSRSVPTRSAAGYSWRRLKWSTVTEQWLKKFFRRLQMYHNDFVLVIACAQLKMQVSIHNDLSSLRHRNMPSIEHRTIEQAPSKSPEGEVQLRYSCSTPKAIYYYHAKGHSSIIWKRSTYCQRPLLGCKSTARNQIVPVAHSYNVQVCINVFNFRYVYLAYSISRNLGHSASLSTQSSISFPCIVRDDSPVASLARKGDIASMETIFRARRASPSDRLTSGSTLLHIAVEGGHLELVGYLIVRGADVNATDNYGSTPLHTALAFGQSYDIARVLLGHGSDVGIQNASGRTPLHCWANSVVRRVLQVHDGPIDLYAADNNGMTVVHFMSRSKMTHPEQVRRLVENDVHCLAARDNLGYLPIEYALMRGNTILSSYLLEHSIVPAMGFIGASGAPILHAAAQSSRTEVIDLALRHCPCIQVADHLGRSAVHAAVLVDNAAAIRKIAEFGASDLLRRPDGCGETPLQLAWRVQAKSCIAFLGLMGVVDTIPTILTRRVPRVEKTALSTTSPTPTFKFPTVVLMILLYSTAYILLFYKLYLN